jgi:hypothetical protein
MKLSDLTPEQKRIAIAEACGWASLQVIHGDPMGRPPNVKDEYRFPPDYLNDLNAMASAVMTLDIVSKRVFAETLRQVCDDELPGDVLGDEFVIQNATAAQRADAFLLATGRAEL